MATAGAHRHPGAFGRRRPFWRIATAGVFFQGGAAAVDPGTIVAALVNGLTGSAFAVGAAAAISRYGWLFPQLFVAYFAQRRRRRLPFYMLGAFGRVGCLAAVALLLLLSGALPGALVIAGFFALWTAYAFVSGIVAVPYNDIVARLIPSAARSRMLALRFFGGGLLALVVAAVANRLLDALVFPSSYAAVLSFGTALLLISTLSFISAGEPEAATPPDQPRDFPAFLRAGLDIFRGDHRFRLFVYVRWLAGVVTMALPFYVLQATGAGLSAADVAILLGAQTTGALASNPFWGFLGDRRGKRSVLEAAALLALAPPALTLAWIAFGAGSTPALLWFVAVFVLLGAAGNGETIAQLGYLMDISPDDRRPAYSGYFNALVAPAALSPVLGAALLEATSPQVLFATSAAAAVVAWVAVRRLRRSEGAPTQDLRVRLRRLARRGIARSWPLAKIYYRQHGIRLEGRPDDLVWYFAYGANMHDSAFRERRGMQPLEWRPGRIRGYRLRFNLEGRPIGKAAPANIAPDPDAEVWGVLYRITRKAAVRLDFSEGVPGRRYRHLWLDAEDVDGNRITPTFTYIAEGKPTDGRPSRRYLTLLRDGARAHHLPEPWLQYLDQVQHAE